MKKKILNTLKYLLFLSIGIFIFLWVYREYDLQDFISTLKQLKWGWVILSLILYTISHLSRAMRWNMLINSLNYSPKLKNTFFAVIIMYATNLIIPRGGEIARCSVLKKYEKVPFTKLIGTVVTERATDMLVLILVVIITLSLQVNIFKEFIANNPQFGEKLNILLSVKFWIPFILLSFTALFLIWKFRNKLKQVKLFDKIFKFIYEFWEGIKSIKDLDKPWLYIFHSLLINALYFCMMYVVFFSYTPTENVGFVAGLTAFVMGGLAMVAPVQGGIGAWHFMIIETLYLYGLDKVYGQNFALISHTSTNLFILILGGICFILLPIINRNKTINYFSEENNK